MGKSFKILMIDDDPDYIEAIKAILESKSYEVIFATSGEAGLRLALEKKPQLILLDVIMPGKSGFSMAEEFKNNSQLSSTPILMLTAFAEKRAGSGVPVSSGFNVETDDYIDKTVSPEELLAKIGQYAK